ncbi:hypothetical protein PYCC9005_004135 [Savitreella phatthalungensis]
MLLSNCFLVLGLAPSSVWAGVAEDVVAAGRSCGSVNSLVSKLGSASASSARAFCNNYLGVKPTSTVTVSASAVTTTTVSICPGSASTTPAGGLVKRATTASRFVRTPGPQCPSYLTAIGTAALSSACSCLTSKTATTTTVTPTSTVTKFQQRTSTFTSTVTIQASPLLSYSTATLVSTTTTTILSNTTSTIIETADIQATSTFTPVFTYYRTPTVTVTRSVTSTSEPQIMYKRTAPASAAPAASSSTPVNNCNVVVVTTVVTVTSTSTSTIATTTMTTSTFVTSSTFAASTTALSTRTLPTAVVIANPSTVTVDLLPAKTHVALNYLNNGDFEDPGPLSSTWRPGDERLGTVTVLPGAGVNNSTAVEFTPNEGGFVQLDQQQPMTYPKQSSLVLSYAGLQEGCRLEFHYVFNDRAIFSTYEGVGSPSYTEYVTIDPDRFDTSVKARFVYLYYKCKPEMEAPVRIDNVFFGSL